jgi:hypothetical protein
MIGCLYMYKVYACIPEINIVYIYMQENIVHYSH